MNFPPPGDPIVLVTFGLPVGLAETARGVVVISIDLALRMVSNGVQWAPLDFTGAMAGPPTFWARPEDVGPYL